MTNLQLDNLNFIAILVVWIIHIVLGLIWFSSALFGKAWSELTGQDLKPSKKWLIPGMLGHLLATLVLAILINITGTTSGFGGIVIGLLIWIGYIVPLEIGELVWEKIPVKLFLIRAGNHLVGLSAAGFILGIWR